MVTVENSLSIKEVSVDNVVITDHAIQQFRLRTGCSKSDLYIENKIRKMLKNATPAELKKEFRVIQLLNHDVEEAHYYKYNNFIIVVCDDACPQKKIVKTIHKGEADRWEYKG